MFSLMWHWHIDGDSEFIINALKLATGKLKLEYKSISTDTQNTTKKNTKNIKQ